MVAGLFATCLLSLLLPIIVLASPHASNFLNRHHGLARRAEANVQLYKRGGDRLSFYNTETGSAGSCGSFLTNSGFTVAMNAAQMQSSFCGKSITISYNGKSTTATVEDTCPGCPYRGLDLSPGLFSFFAPQSVGIIYAEWEFAGAPAPAPPAPSPTHTPTWTPPPPPPSPSPYVPPAPPSISIPTISIPAWTSSSSTSSTPTSTHSHTNSHNLTAAVASSSTSTSTSSSSINYASGAASGLAEPTGSAVATPGTGDNIQNLFQTFIAFSGLIEAAHNG